MWLQAQFNYYEDVEMLLWAVFYMLSFVFVYYSYAILFQTGQQNSKNLVLSLMLLIFVSSFILTVLEMIQLRPPIAGVLFLLFGLYFVCCFISDKIRLSLRGFAWSLFLPMFIVYWYVFLSTPFM